MRPSATEGRGPRQAVAPGGAGTFQPPPNTLRDVLSVATVFSLVFIVGFSGGMAPHLPQASFGARSYTIWVRAVAAVRASSAENPLIFGSMLTNTISLPRRLTSE